MGISTFGGSDLSVGKYPDLYLPNKGYIAGNYYPPTVSGQASTTINSIALAGYFFFSPFYCSRTHTFTKIGMRNGDTTDSGDKFRLGIYADDGTGMPSTLVLDAGEITLDGAVAFREIAISQELEGSTRYWLAAFFGAQLEYARIDLSPGSAQGQTPELGYPGGLGSSVGNSVSGVPSLQGATYGALPADVSTESFGKSSSCPFILLGG